MLFHIYWYLLIAFSGFLQRNESILLLDARQGASVHVPLAPSINLFFFGLYPDFIRTQFSSLPSGPLLSGFPGGRLFEVIVVNGVIRVQHH